MHTRIWAAALLVTVCAALYGCGDEVPDTATAPVATALNRPEPAAAPTATALSRPDPTPTATVRPSVAPSARQSPGVAPPPDYGVKTLAETVLDAAVIARVQLLSRATSTISAGGAQWQPRVDFTFTVHEYLKGSGASTITASITGSNEDTQELAVAEAERLLARHDTQWDRRQAIVFLRNDPRGLTSTYWLGGGWVYWDGDTSFYQVSSRHERNWLPEAPSNTGKGTRSAADPSFMLAVSGAPAGARGGRSTPGGEDTITLSALKARIGELETEANAGGTDDYRACIKSHYWRTRLLSALLRDGTLPVTGHFSVKSGQPDALIWEHRFYAATRDDYSEASIGRHWFEGQDPGLAKHRAVDFQPDGNRVRYTSQIVTARPLPAGTYRFFYNWLSYFDLICDKPSPLEKNQREWQLTVTAPPRTLHEAFFDPVDIGTAVGADGANGVLKPAAFSLDGTTTTISSLKWEGGTVTLGASPTSTLAGHAIDFIDVTGTTTLSLTSDNASTTPLTWTVPDKPWADGDLLMLRIRDTPAAEPRDRDAYPTAAGKHHVPQRDRQLGRPSNVRRSVLRVHRYGNERRSEHGLPCGDGIERLGLYGLAVQQCPGLLGRCAVRPVGLYQQQGGRTGVPASRRMTDAPGTR